MSAPVQTPRHAAAEPAAKRGRGPSRAARLLRAPAGWFAALGRLLGAWGRSLAQLLQPPLEWLSRLVGPPARALSRVAAPVVQRVREPLGAISSLGRGTILIGLVALGGGLFLGWAELLALGAVLLLTPLLAVAFILGRPSYEVHVDLASLRVVVGDRASGGIRIGNVAERSVAPSVIELPVGRAVASFPVPRLDPGQVHDELFTIPTQRRAVLTLGPVRSVRQDPLELLRRRVEWTEPEDIYVHPLTVRLDNSSTGFVRDLEGLPTRDLANDDVSFHALREYVPGDDLRHVHWRSTARTNKLMIRQFEETRRSQFVILLSTRMTDYTSEDEFELGISIAASLARSAQIDGKEVSVFTSDRLLPSPTPARLLDAFSAIEPSTARTSFAERARAVAADVPGASVVALISGGAAPIEELRVASIRIPVMARCFAVRAAVEDELGRRAIGDFAIATVPALADLPRAMKVVSA